MRNIPYDNLQSWRINGIQYVRDKVCKKRGVVCFTCEKGWIKKSCEQFVQKFNGFNCDEKSIKIG